MNWILALALYSNPNGVYTQEFSTEKECTSAMSKLVTKLEKTDTSNVKSISCLPEDTFEEVSF